MPITPVNARSSFRIEARSLLARLELRVGGVAAHPVVGWVPEVTGNLSGASSAVGLAIAIRIAGWGSVDSREEGQEEQDESWSQNTDS